MWTSGGIRRLFSRRWWAVVTWLQLSWRRGRIPISGAITARPACCRHGARGHRQDAARVPGRRECCQRLCFDAPSLGLVVDMLIEAGATAEARDHRVHTLLISASQKGTAWQRAGADRSRCRHQRARWPGLGTIAPSSTKNRHARRGRDGALHVEVRRRTRRLSTPSAKQLWTLLARHSHVGIPTDKRATARDTCWRTPRPTGHGIVDVFCFCASPATARSNYSPQRKS